MLLIIVAVLSGISCFTVHSATWEVPSKMPLCFQSPSEQLHWGSWVLKDAAPWYSEKCFKVNFTDSEDWSQQQLVTVVHLKASCHSTQMMKLYEKQKSLFLTCAFRFWALNDFQYLKSLQYKGLVCFQSSIFVSRYLNWLFLTGYASSFWLLTDGEVL